MRHITRRTLQLALLLAASIIPAAAARAQTPAPAATTTGNAVAGKQLYFDHGCYGCHGFNGETGARPLARGMSVNGEANFIRFLRLRADQNPILPSTRMPNYSQESLSDAQARDIYAFILGFRNNPPNVADVPVFKTILDAATRPYKP